MNATSVGIALGSNLGDRSQLIHDGLACLRTLSDDDQVRPSSLHETQPIDCPPGSPPFLNAAAIILYRHSVHDLLAALQAFEHEKGRATWGQRRVNAPRPLDLDILFFGNDIVKEADLIIPHPRLAERRFVLEPLAELEPERILPGFSLPVSALLAKLLT